MTNGPIFSIWHIDGHGYQWQIDQLNKDLPIEPSIRMPAGNQMSDKSGLDANAAMLSKFDGRSISLRMNNLTNELDYTFGRINPLTEENWVNSFLSIRRLSDGTLDDTPIPSPWAGTTAWSNAGRIWALSNWFKRLQEIIPNPKSVVLRENNEGPEFIFDQLYLSTRVRWYRADNNTMQFATINTPRDKWLWDSSTITNQIPIVGDDWKIWYGNTGDTLFVYRWKTDQELDYVDLRAKEWMATHRHLKPNECQQEIVNLVKEQYLAFFSSFVENLSESWKSVWNGNVGYGSDPYHDSNSLQTYTGFYRAEALTHPDYINEVVERRKQWEKEKVNPKSWRELSIRLRGPTVYANRKNNSGDFVESESYAGFNVFYAWAMQSINRDVRLVWWEGYLTKPTANVLNDSWKASATSLGATPEILNLTVGQCEVAIMQHLDRIHKNPILNKYWKQGITNLLTSPINTTSTIKIYATETKIDGLSNSLLFVYSPSTITTPINVGPYTLSEGFSRYGYYLASTNSVIPLDLNIDYKPIADFNFSIDNSTVTFTNNSTSPIDNVTYFWDFGDGITSTEKDVVHVYTPGTYTVTLTVTNGLGLTSEILTVIETETPEQQITRLQEEILMLKQKIDELSALNVQQTQKIVELEAAGNELEAALTTLQTSNDELSNKVIQLETDKTNILSKIDNIKQTVEEFAMKMSTILNS